MIYIATYNKYRYALLDAMGGLMEMTWMSAGSNNMVMGGGRCWPKYLMKLS
jgi:hypothetical protein